MAIRRFYGHNAKPPKKYAMKMTTFIPLDGEGKFVSWAKENCSGDIDYTIIHYGDGVRSQIRTELEVYFKSKSDAVLFKLTYL